MSDNQKPYIFINYRRAGAKPYAVLIKKILEAYFGWGTVFLDTASIKPGRNFEQEILTHLEAAHFLVVLIHNSWLLDHSPADRYIPRIQLDQDWVRQEIRYFLEKEKTILPILLDEAPQPTVNQLPEDIVGLAPLQSIQVRNESIENDLHPVLNAIEKAGFSRQPTQGAPKENSARQMDYFPLPESHYRPDQLQQIPHPFIGLRYFTAKEAAIYFGREPDIQQLINLIEDSDRNLILLYGPSGIGKSSLLNAGLLPRLLGRYKLSAIHRRDYATGLDHQFEAILRAWTDYSLEGQHVLFFDQVEEIFTDPNSARPNEIVDFFASLTKWLLTIQEKKWPIKIILSFRKEQLSELLMALEDRGLAYLKFPLKPLSKSGVQQAIVGVTRRQELRDHFNLSITEAFAEAMIDRIYRQAQVSHIAPLLQLQLRSIWDYLLDQKLPVRQFDENIYDLFKRKGLEQMVYYQLDHLPVHWNQYRAKGLILHVLKDLVTAKATAGEARMTYLENRYQHLEALNLPALLRDLQNAYLIFRKDANTYRLAHDQLGPIILQMEQESVQPAQLAWRIIEALDRLQEKEVEFSDKNLKIVDEGYWYMPGIPARIRTKMETDRQRLHKQRQFRFESDFNQAIMDIENLECASAFERLQLALLQEIRQDEIRQKALDLPYGYYWLKRFDLCQSWLEWMVERGWMSPDQQRTFPTLGQDAFAEELLLWLQAFDPEHDARMQARYFPKMLPISGGAFAMGSQKGEANEKPVHRVRLSPFELSETPVTAWQYGIYCQDTGKPLPFDSNFGRGDRPVIQVSWYDTLGYCNWLSAQQGLEPVYQNIEQEGDKPVLCDWSKNGYRLPTEAEWEYAAREAGQAHRFGNGQMEAKLAEINYNGASHYNNWFDYVEAGPEGSGTNRVFRFKPNALGLYDMSGNVYEWCWDKYLEENRGRWQRPYYKTSRDALNPTGPKGRDRDDYRVVRGGSWVETAYFCRCASRNGSRPINRNNYSGFRVARRAN